MTIITISNQAELLSALKTATGGETFLLADGDYGSIEIKKDFAAKVYIIAQNPQGAVFEKIVVNGGSNIGFDGVEVAGEFRAWKDAQDISVVNVKTVSFYFRDVDGLAIDHSEAAGGYHTLILNDVSNFAITNSHFHDALGDVSRITGNSYNGLFENNIFADTHASPPEHPDLMQMFNVGSATPHDIIIRGNLFYDDPATGSVVAQGIFLGDASSSGYRNILVEDNTVSVSSPNSIYINGGQENVVIRSNTLMTANDGTGATIRLAEKSGLDNSGVVVEANVARSIIDETKQSTIGDNYTYGKTPLSDIFESTTGEARENYQLKDSALGGQYGAAFASDTPQAPVLEEGLPPLLAISPPAPQKVYGFSSKLFTGNMDGRVVVHQHDQSLEIDEGTIALRFNADITGWRRSLISKDANGSGDHFGIWIQDSTLHVKAGDASHEETIVIKGVTAKQSYDLVASFDEDSVDIWLNGEHAGRIDVDMDWSDNHETLVIGADNALSASGSTSSLRYLYDGTLKDFAIYDQAMTPEELQAHLSSTALV